MNNEHLFYKCEVCGNLIEKIEDSGVALICCEQEMTLLRDNTVDAAKEKHVPVITKEDNKIKVMIGSIPHPMTKEHYISWIMININNISIRKDLNPGDEPSIEVPFYDEGKITAYAYCNLHGLWSNELQ
jgi:superoxide reductase